MRQGCGMRRTPLTPQAHSRPRCTWKQTAAAELKDLAALHARFGLDSSRWPEDYPAFETAVHMLHSFRAEWELFMDSVACGRQPVKPAEADPEGFPVLARARRCRPTVAGALQVNLGRAFCPLANLLAQLIPMRRDSRQSASLNKLRVLPRLPSVEEARIRW